MRNKHHARYGVRCSEGLGRKLGVLVVNTTCYALERLLLAVGLEARVSTYSAMHVYAKLPTEGSLVE